MNPALANAGGELMEIAPDPLAGFNTTSGSRSSRTRQSLSTEPASAGHIKYGETRHDQSAIHLARDL
jgi:hypothetical protein